MRRVRPVASAKAYLESVRALGAGGDIPLLGHRPESLRRLAAAYDLDLPVDPPEDEGTSNGPTASIAETAGAYRDGLAGARPDGARLVVGVGTEAVAAACHAVLGGARLEMVDDLGAIAGSLRRETPESLTIVGAARHFSPSGIRLLHTLVTERGIPWGLLTGQTPEAIGWSVLKQRVAAGRRRPHHLLLYPLEDRPGGRPPAGPVSALYGSEITADVLRGLTHVPRDLVAITGHGDQADAYLYAGWLCTRTRPDHERLADATGGDRLMRCFAEHDCYRSVALAAHDGIPAERKVLVPADRLNATVVLLNSCASLLASPGYRYRVESSLLNTCLEGIVPAAVALETVRPTDPAEAMLFSGLVRTGFTLGEATLALNRTQTRYFNGLSAFVLFGDPDLRLSAPPVENTTAEVEDGTVLRPVPLDSGTHATRTRLAPGSYERLNAETVEAGSPGRVFLVPGRTSDDLVVVADRPFEGTAPSVRFASVTGGGAESVRPGLARLRLLQRRLAELAMLTCPVDAAGTDRLRERIATALRAVHTTSGGGAKSAREAAARDELGRELLLFQTSVVQGWTSAWAGSLTGEMISLVEDRVLYGPFVASDLDCPACGSPLARVGVEDLYLPGALRTMWHCPSCTVVADLPDGAALSAVETAPAVRRGGTCEVGVELPGEAGPPGVTVVAAAIVGARGRCRPAIMPAARTAQRGGRSMTRLVMPVGADMVPGSYSLRVVIMDDLETRFHLRPISITTR